MLLWELISGRRHKNKDRARQQQQQQQQQSAPGASTAGNSPATKPSVASESTVCCPAAGSAPQVIDGADRKAPPTLAASTSAQTGGNKPALAGATAVSGLLAAGPALAGPKSASSGSLPHQDDDSSLAGSTSTLLQPIGRPQPPGRLSPQTGRPPDSIKLFKNAALARRHSTSFGLYPGLLGPTSVFGIGSASGGSGAGRSRRRRTDEGGIRLSDRRRPHKYSSLIYCPSDRCSHRLLTLACPV